MNHDLLKEFYFGDLIDDIYKGKAINKDELTILNYADDEKSIPYITRTSNNNGCECYADVSFINKSKIEKGNAVTIGDTTATVFYQPNDFIVGDHMVIIRSKWINKLRALYIVSLLIKERYRYSYGRAFLIESIKSTILKLPAIQNDDGSYSPDWQFMEDYIKSLHHKPLTTKNKADNVSSFDVKNWKDFKIGNIFKTSTSPLSIKAELEKGTVPLISRSALNNGCDGYFDVSEEKISKGNCITIGAEGIFAFYQPNNFATGNKVYTLKNVNLNKYNALFITTILNKEAYKYSYGRARILSKLSNEIIKLPAITKEDGTYEPDWEYMENYIKSLPYGDRI